MGISLRPVAYIYPDERNYISLDGDWLFQEDPIGIGEKERWFSRELKKIYSRRTKVPLPWQAQFPDLADYAGTAWYARSFTIPKDAKFVKALLDFTAVDHEATVWINGVYVGQHIGGYSRFAFEVGALLRPGEENHLVVRVNDPKNIALIPHGKQGSPWYQNISGIWGSVYLEFLRDSIILSDVVLTALSTEGDVNIRVQVKRLEDQKVDKAFKLRCTMEGAGTKFQLINDEAIILPARSLLRAFSFSQKIENVVLWTINDPRLYKIEIFLLEVPEKGNTDGVIVDSVSLEWGLRQISVVNRQICLNGQPIVLRGVLDQAYYPKTLYTPPSDDFIKSEITAMKRLGVNLIRKHIKVEDPRYFYWCDHLGMLCWAEPPNFIIPNIKGFRIFKETLTSMVIRDRNHPSIIIWGIFNEEWGIWGAWFGIWNLVIYRFYNRVKQIDASRLVVDNSGWAHARTDLNDYHHYFMAPDSDYFWTRQLRAIKTHPQWNYNLGIVRKPADSPQIISEYGCGGISDLAWMEPIQEGQEPYWYRHNGMKSEIQGIVVPFRFAARFQKLGISRFFGTLKEFAAKSQWREYTSNKFTTEEMRRLNFAGYILTELADIEWEYNGLLQYDRSPKVFNNHYSLFNSDDLLIIRPNKRTYLAGETIHLRFFLSVFSDLRVDAATLRWQIPALQITGEARVIIRKYQPYLLHEAEIPIPPECSTGLNTPINAQLITNTGSTIVQNFEPVSIISQSSLPNSTITTPLQIYDPNGQLTKNLAAWHTRGFITRMVTQGGSWDTNIPCIAVKMDNWVRNFIHAGGKVLYSLEFLLPPKEKRLVLRKPGIIHLDALQTLLPKVFFSKKLPGLPIQVKPYFRGETWDGMFSLLFADPQIFQPLPFQNPLNWESNTIWPDFKLKLLRNIPMQNVLAGMVFGWANAMYPLVLKLDVGKGKLIVSTLNLLRNVTEDPVAAVVCFNLVRELKKEF